MSERGVGINMYELLSQMTDLRLSPIVLKQNSPNFEVFGPDRLGTRGFCLLSIHTEGVRFWCQAETFDVKRKGFDTSAP